MKTNHRIFAALTAACLMAGCSSVQTKTNMAQDEARASEIQARMLAAHRNEKQKQMEGDLAQVPAWAMEPQKPDDVGVYAVGQAESDVMRVALRKAMLEGEFGLAKAVHQEISGSERSYSQDNRAMVGNEQYTELIDKLVRQVPVVGLEVVKQEVKPINGTYHAFILLRLPYAEFNRVLLEQEGRETDKAIIQAFKDLQVRLAQRSQEQQPQHEVIAAAPVASVVQAPQVKKAIPPPIPEGGLPPLPQQPADQAR